MGKIVVRIIEEPQKQSDCFHVNVKQTFPPLKTDSGNNVSKPHKYTIENFNQSKELHAPMVFYRDKGIVFMRLPSLKDNVVYHWSDDSGEALPGSGPFSADCGKKIFFCTVDFKSRTRSQIENIEISILKKELLYIPLRTFKEFRFSPSVRSPRISMIGSSISITASEPNNPVILAWTTDPNNGYHYNSNDIPKDTQSICYCALDLNCFMQSSRSTLKLQELNPPTYSINHEASAFTVDSGNASSFLSIRGNLAENIKTSLSKLTFPISCITRSDGFSFYGTMHNSIQSKSIIINNPGSTKKEAEFILGDDRFYVVQNFSCFENNHTIIPRRARIPFFHDGILKEVVLPAFVCTECAKVYIFEPNLWDIPNGYESARLFIRPSGEIIFDPPKGLPGIRQEISPLRKSGYTTGKGGPSDITRIQVLKRMIDLRVFGNESKNRICSYLKHFIETNYNQNSIPKWESDLAKISEYDGNPSYDYIDSK